LYDEYEEEWDSKLDCESKLFFDDDDDDDDESNDLTLEPLDPFFYLKDGSVAEELPLSEY